MTSTRVKGHAFRGVECNVYGDRRYVCECGDTGSPAKSVDDARWDHRNHKKSVVFDVTRHSHNVQADDPLTGYFHTHPWGSVVHSHMLRAVCSRPECKGFATHNIHPDLVPSGDGLSQTALADAGDQDDDNLIGPH